MASTIVVSKAVNSAFYQITGLTNLWSDSYYLQCCVTKSQIPSSGVSAISNWNPFEGSFSSASPFGTSKNTNAIIIPNLYANTPYTIYGAVQALNKTWYPCGYANFTTLANSGGGGGGGAVPSGTLGLTVSAGTGSSDALQFTLNWNAVSGSGGGTTSYDVYKKKTSSLSDSQFLYYTTTTSTFSFVAVDEYDTPYDFKVVSKNNVGSGVFQIVRGTRSGSASSGGGEGTGVPIVGESEEFYVYSNAEFGEVENGSAICWGLFSGVEYATTYKLYANDQAGSGDVLKWSGGWGTIRFLLDKPNYSYKLKLYACNSYGCSVNYMKCDFTTPPTWEGVRPYDWTWANPKTQGTAFNLTVAEWNDFTNHINDFRTYYDKKYTKTIGKYSFTTAPFDPSKKFYAWIYNQAVTAISQMSPPISIPTDTALAKSSGEKIYARYFNELSNSLNSII